MRHYDDSVEVRRGEADRPEQFLWHGRLWKVRAVHAHWVETGPWWQSSGVRALLGADEPNPSTRSDLLVERELWRVEAGRGGDNAGIFDLSFSWSDGCWQLVGCSD